MGKLLTLHDPHSARSHYLSGVWRSDTMYGLLRAHAVERGDAYALRDARQRLTWAMLRERVDAVAHALDRAGLVPGDRVSVWLPNRVEATIVLLACSRNGYVCNPSLHQSYTVAEIAQLLERIDCRALFAQPGHGADAGRDDVFRRALALPAMRAVFALAPHAQAPASAPAAVSVPAPAPVSVPAAAALPERVRPFPEGRAPADARAPKTDPDQIVYLAFTSGTTGTPKGVMHSDNTLLANGRTMVADWRHDARTVILSLSPMSHHIGTVALEQSLVCGAELVMTDPAAGIAPIDWIEQTGATYVMGVPTHAMDLLRSMQQRGLPGLGRVKVFYMAGATIPRELANRFLQLGVTPQNVYGMTENGSHQYTLPGDGSETIVATCGRACQGYEVRLWKQEDRDVEAAPGEIGEIGGRGGLLMLGYFANQAATESAFNAHGWFMSGDLGQFDEHGNLRIVGRKKDLIIRGGHNIYPAKIEDLAHRHPHVAKAAAFAVPDDRLGERVCLAVIGKDGAPPADELLDHLAALGLSKYDMPEFYLALDEFPLTPSGKILKRDLVEWARSGRVAPQPVRWRARTTEA